MGILIPKSAAAKLYRLAFRQKREPSEVLAELINRAAEEAQRRKKTHDLWPPDRPQPESEAER